MKPFVVVLLLLCARACDISLAEKSDKCIEECLEEEWDDVEEREYEAAARNSGERTGGVLRCKDRDGNIVSCQQQQQQSKVPSTESDVVVFGGKEREVVDRSCAHCRDGQICVGFPEDNYDEPECVDNIGPCGEQCDVGEDCRRVAGNRYNCVLDPSFDICDTCTADEICLGFPGDDVPNDCYEIDDELPCAGMCEDFETCTQRGRNEYHCIPH